MGIKLHYSDNVHLGQQTEGEVQAKTYPLNTAPPVTVLTVTPSTGKPL